MLPTLLKLRRRHFEPEKVPPFAVPYAVPFAVPVNVTPNSSGLKTSSTEAIEKYFGGLPLLETHE